MAIFQHLGKNVFELEPPVGGSVPYVKSLVLTGGNQEWPGLQRLDLQMQKNVFKREFNKGWNQTYRFETWNEVNYYLVSRSEDDNQKQL